jgi:anti-sigma regulatory factor (Ser/Thr protein kinase)
MSKVAPAVVQTRIFDGSPQEVHNVRVYVAQFVDGCPVAEDAVSLSSELATNAVLHSKSGAGGTFSVSVLVESGLVRVEVHDLGSATTPSVRRSRQPSVSGAGLRIVETLADRWGFDGDQNGRTVWFEMACIERG